MNMSKAIFLFLVANILGAGWVKVESKTISSTMGRSLLQGNHHFPGDHDYPPEVVAAVAKAEAEVAGKGGSVNVEATTTTSDSNDPPPPEDDDKPTPPPPEDDDEDDDKPTPPPPEDDDEPTPPPPEDDDEPTPSPPEDDDEPTPPPTKKETTPPGEKHHVDDGPSPHHAGSKATPPTDPAPSDPPSDPDTPAPSDPPSDPDTPKAGVPVPEPEAPEDPPMDKPAEDPMPEPPMDKTAEEPMPEEPAAEPPVPELPVEDPADPPMDLIAPVLDAPAPEAEAPGPAAICTTLAQALGQKSPAINTVLRNDIIPQTLLDQLNSADAMVTVLLPPENDLSSLARSFQDGRITQAEIQAALSTHIITEAYSAADFSGMDGEEVATANPLTPLDVSVDGSVISFSIGNETATVTEADIDSCGTESYIHSISNILTDLDLVDGPIDPTNRDIDIDAEAGAFNVAVLPAAVASVLAAVALVF